jgi:hypothetical protein
MHQALDTQPQRTASRRLAPSVMPNDRPSRYPGKEPDGALLLVWPDLENIGLPLSASEELCAIIPTNKVSSWFLPLWLHGKKHSAPALAKSQRSETAFVPSYLCSLAVQHHFEPNTGDPFIIGLFVTPRSSSITKSTPSLHRG